MPHLKPLGRYAVMPKFNASTSEAIISKITYDFSNLLQLYRNVSATELQVDDTEDQRSVKNTFAIVSAWIWRCAALLDAAHQSNVPLLADPDVAGLNQEYYYNRKCWTRLEVELDFYKSHLTLLKVLKRFPVDRLLDDPVQQLITTEVYRRHQDCYAALKQYQ